MTSTLKTVIRKASVLAFLGVLLGPMLASAGDWTSLFDGESLAGWVQRGGMARYRIDGDAIVGSTVEGSPNTFLCTETHYADFVLELEFRVDDRLNSGVQIRSNSYSNYRDGRVHGYQVEIDPSSRAWSAGIYDEARRGWLAKLEGDEKREAREAFRNGEWNHYRIEAVGTRIRTWINGVPAADLDDSLTANGFIALQVHSAREAGLEVRWRNIRLREVEAPRPRIRVLLVDGQNNHDWRSTTPVMVAILEDAGIFDVTVATTPGELANFKPKFTDYDVLVSNYNGAEWPEETRKGFADFVRSGGGFVSVHAADNSFPGWPEYNEMIGLGGWGGRNERSGPLVYVKDGKVVRDTSPGGGGSHGSQHDFVVRIREPLHPITAGLPELWLHARDELYATLRGPAKKMSILATAFAEPKTGGTGRDEPMLMGIDYGEGRVFHTTLGHSAHSMRCAGFAFTLQRGVEWAASGRVTLVETPPIFPSSDSVRMWLPMRAFDRISSYDFGGDRRELSAIEDSLRGAPTGYARLVERKLIAVLESDEATYAARQYAVRLLRRIGSDVCVPALAGFLADPELSHNARFALQRLPGKAATAALLGAFVTAKGDLRAGLAASLGDRGGVEVERALLDALDSSLADESIARAIIASLGRVGGLTSAGALEKLEVDGALARTRDSALLTCADRMLASGAKGASLPVYRRLSSDASRPVHVRLAALRGIAEARGSGAAAMLLALSESKDAELSAGARQILRDARNRGIVRGLLAAYPWQSPVRQVTALETLEARGSREGRIIAERALARNDTRLRDVALRTLGTLGDASTVALLAAHAAGQGPGAMRARESLARLNGEAASLEIRRLVKSPELSLRRAAVDVLRRRADAVAVAGLLEAARDADSVVRAESSEALAAIAPPETIGAIAGLLADAPLDERSMLESGLASLASRTRGGGEAEKASRDVLAAFEGADLDARLRLFATLAEISAPSGLEMLRGLLAGTPARVQSASVAALARWRTPEPLEDLLRIAKQENASLGEDALGGAMRLLALPSDRSALTSVEIIEDVLEVVESKDAKRSVLERLAKFPCKEALELAESLSEDEDLADLAKSAAASIRSTLLAGSMVATASHNPGDARRAFDSSPTRWSTNTPMRPGMWFSVDLGAERLVRGLILDSRDSPGDYPRGCELHVSANGKDWGKAVYSSPPQRPITRITLREPVRARFIKIVQTGETQGLFWSIHELKIQLAD